MDNKGSEKPKSACARACEHRCCLVVILLAVAAGIALSVAVVLLSPSIKVRFAPDLKWWQTSTIYKIYPRSFQDSDGDGVGDLKGIISRLDHFFYLNVGVIWIAPFYPSAQRDLGYDVTNHVDVDPLFGTLDDFDRLLEGAHNRSLRVVIDLVPGYTSTHHAWFTQSEQRVKPYDHYYLWAAGQARPNRTHAPPTKWTSAFGAWHWSQRREEYYYHCYSSHKPQLNYGSGKVRQEMKGVIRFWLNRGVDGFYVNGFTPVMAPRHDTQDKQLRDQWMSNFAQVVPQVDGIIKGWREVLDSVADEEEDDDDDKDNSKFLMAESYNDSGVKGRYYDNGVDMVFNFDLLLTINPVLQQTSCDAVCIRDVIQKVYSMVPDGKWTNFMLSSQDYHRACSRLGPLYTDALHVLLLTLRGTPITYYGEELGMQDITVAFKDTKDPRGIDAGSQRYRLVSRDPSRSPMQWERGWNAGFTTAATPWLPLNPDYNPAINVEAEMTSPNITTLKVYSDLAALRHLPSIQYGVLRFCDVSPSILSFSRSAEDHPQFLVAINFGTSTVTGDFSGCVADKGQGHIMVATSDAVIGGRYQQRMVVTLSRLTLNPGDGLVVQL